MTVAAAAKAGREEGDDDPEGDRARVRVRGGTGRAGGWWGAGMVLGCWFCVWSLSRLLDACFTTIC